MPKKKPDQRRKRGVDFQRWVADWLMARGWVVHNQLMRTVRIFIPPAKVPIYVSRSQDIFGCIDLVAKKKGHGTLWIQATLDRGIGLKNKKLDTVPWSPWHDGDEVEVWVKRAVGHVDIFNRELAEGNLVLVGKITRGVHRPQEEGGSFGIDYGEKIKEERND
jgi:hypothetical protein